MSRIFDRSKLKIDCDKCDALCCVAFKLPYADYQKPAGVACRNLDSSRHRCVIYQDLERKSYTHCTQFDCRGAGVAISHVFRAMGRTWIDDPDVASIEFSAFVIVYYTLLAQLYPDTDFEYAVLQKLSPKLKEDLKPFTEAALDFLASDDSGPD